MPEQKTPPELAQARERFLALVSDLPAPVAVPDRAQHGRRFLAPLRAHARGAGGRAARAFASRRGGRSYAVRSALLSFLALPVLQRSAVILKDVLGHSLGGIASTIGTTVPAVKAALARGRSKLRQMGAQGPETREGAMAADELEDLRRYARLFNATRLGRCPRAAGRRVPA